MNHEPVQNIRWPNNIASTSLDLKVLLLEVLCILSPKYYLKLCSNLLSIILYQVYNLISSCDSMTPSVVTDRT